MTEHEKDKEKSEITSSETMERKELGHVCEKHENTSGCHRMKSPDIYQFPAQRYHISKQDKDVLMRSN